MSAFAFSSVTLLSKLYSNHVTVYIRTDIKDSAGSTKKRNNCWVALSLILYIYRVVEEELLMGRSLDFTELSGGLDLESALIYDAVHLLAVALRQLRY